MIERNRPYDTFGWGVVFSDQTLGNLAAGRPADRARDPATRSTTGTTSTSTSAAASSRSGGHGFCGIGRKRLLNILQARCEELGVKLVFETERRDDQAAPSNTTPTWSIACDGLNSRIRARYAATYQPDVDVRRCRFVWLGTRKLFEAFTFAFEETEHGWFQAHAYRFDDDTSTFIVETPEERVARRRARPDGQGGGASRSASGCSRSTSTATG